MSDDDLSIIGRRIGYGDTLGDPFGLSRADRRRHLYVQGKTGSGKSTLLSRMIIQDIERGEGVCLIDPLGTTAEALLDYIPPSRTDHFRYFNVADLAWPLGLNILAGHDAEHRHRAVAAAVGVFSSTWDLSLARAPQLLDILGYSVAALMEIPGATLLHLPRFLTDDAYRELVLARVSDRGVRDYWKYDFGTRGKRERREACSSVLNKLGELRRDPVMRNIFGQEHSAIDADFLLSRRRILFVNLAQGELGAENARLIGSFIVTTIVSAAARRMQAIKLAEEYDPASSLVEFPDFYLYLEEFQDYATSQFDALLSQSRNGRMSVSCFHQFQDQIPENVRAAIFGNVGSIATFSVGANDAERLAGEFDHHFSPELLTDLREFEIAMKLPKKHGNPSVPFRAFTLPNTTRRYGRRENLIAQSRMRFGREREKVERSVARIIGPAVRPAPPRSSTKGRKGRSS